MIRTLLLGQGWNHRVVRGLLRLALLCTSCTSHPEPAAMPAAKETTAIRTYPSLLGTWIRHDVTGFTLIQIQDTAHATYTVFAQPEEDIATRPQLQGAYYKANVRMGLWYGDSTQMWLVVQGARFDYHVRKDTLLEYDKAGPHGTYVRVQRGAAATTRFPHAVDVSKLGTYTARTFSGGGYFYDEVLEYRVWASTQQQGEYFRAFADYASALRFATQTAGAEAPCVLVRQQEYVDEPEEGIFVPVRTERLTEWRPEWLAGSKRTATSIEQFLAAQSHASN